MVKSKFGILAYIVSLLIFGCAAWGYYFLSQPEKHIRNNMDGSDSNALPGFTLIGLAACLFFMMRRAFILKISPDRLVFFTHFSRYRLEREDIQSIELFGRASVFGWTDEVLS